MEYLRTERECLWYQSVMILRGILSLFLIPEKLQTVLADILEQDADKSFFLKDEMVEKFLRNNEKEGDEYMYRVTERKFTEGDLQEILANG